MNARIPTTVLDAAQALEQRRAEWDRRWALRPIGLTEGGAGPSEEQGAELDDLSLFDLVTAYARISANVQFDRLGEHKVHDEDTPIELHAADILDRLRRSGAERDGARVMPIAGVFADRPKADVIGLFLAVLELVRQGLVRVGMNAESRKAELILLGEPAASNGAQPRAWDDEDPPEDDGEDDREDAREEQERGRLAPVEGESVTRTRG